MNETREQLIDKIDSLTKKLEDISIKFENENREIMAVLQMWKNRAETAEQKLLRK